MAIIKSLELLNSGYDWIVDIDLERFFDTVHHDRLMNIISRTVEDGDVLSLIRKFLVSGVMVDNTYEETKVGTPQGGNLSPLLSNVMLNELAPCIALTFGSAPNSKSFFIGSRSSFAICSRFYIA